MTRRIFAVTIFLGALLLFSVQPMIGKYILPWFGGSTAVWITCMLFFQVMLLAGYAYAHANIRLFGARTGAIVHLVLLALAVAVLPIIPNASWRPSDATYPGLRILLVLLVSVGLPYFVLASTSPLLQAWFGRVQPGKNPYRLYSLSNAGSLLALMIYPFALEPYLGRTSQAWIWSICMILYGVSCAACVVAAWKPKPAEAPRDRVAGLVDAQARQEVGSQGPPQATVGVRLLWLLLPAVAVILLLAVTNVLTQELGALPFLWILPLGLYLITFIICFDHQRWYDRRALIPVLLASMLLLTFFICWKEAVLWQRLLVYLVTMFIACMACHGEVYRLKPDPRHLTGFYLMIAAGGALGGAFVALVAPLIFTGFFELQVGMLACVLLVLLAVYRDPNLVADRRTLGTLTMASVVILAPLLWYSTDSGNEHVLKARRDFYGVLKIMTTNDTQGSPMHIMLNGRTIHGVQYVGSSHDLRPTGYYAPNSGIGLTLDSMPQRSRRIGVIGLGIGTLSAYCRPGDTIRFYEIDPQVIELAQSDFTFLKNCQGKLEIIPGDARVTMERESDQHYDVLVLDAYSGDTVPAHLLTKEAFEVYRRHLRKGGVLAAHISNRYYSLQCVVEPVAESIGMQVRYVTYGSGSTTSLWVLMSEDGKLFDNPALAAAIRPVDFPVAPQLWTDEKSNLLSVMTPGAWGR